ncbi:hypothetical protein [Janthinobacterium sp. J1-1]|uniref:hypothetical protein n=1 Tax=Janthinobacterium sp. J1-1 TaxID=3065910 RepID=UPI00281222CA|nr:hypothetical protein [Janthinobacterium sp. J1-1]
MPYKILRNSVTLDQTDGAVTFHLAAFGADKICRVTSTALLSLGGGQGDALSVFEAHSLLIAQRAFAYLSRDLMASSVVLRALDF